MTSPAAPPPAAAAVRIVRVGDVAPQPWRNGGGFARELLAWPAHADAPVRVSVADIDRDGPFSPYPGVERWFAVIGGAGVVLRFDGAAAEVRERVQRRGDPPLVFDGAAAPGCRLVDGPARALNLLLHGATGALRAADAGVRWRPGAAACGLFAAVAGRCTVEHGAHAADAVTLPLAAGALAWFDAAPAALRFDADADAGAGAEADADIEAGTGTGAPAAPPGWWIAATLARGRPR